MNKKKIWIWSLIGMIGLGIILGTQTAYAGSATVSVSPSASNITTGSTVSVTIGISADEAIGYGVAVSYNPAVLEYQGGGDAGGGGTVTILNEGDGSSSSFSRTLTFKAIGTGSSAISASEFAGGVFGYVTGTMAVSYGSATVNVSAPQSTGGSGGSGETPLSGSGDNSLKSLEISPGTLTPAFSSGTTSYAVELPEDTASIVVSAVPNDSKATVAVSHNNDLEPGANKTYIVVTAENGTQKTYVLNITCGEVQEEPKATVTVDGKPYTFATAQQMEETAIPEGFTEGNSQYAGAEILAYLSPNRQLTIVYLLDEEGNGQWFIYDEEQETFQLYMEYQAAGNRYIVLVPQEGIKIPSGYEPVEFELQGQKITAYKKPGNEEFLLIYAMNTNGEAGFYSYDTVEDTWQRYAEPEAVEESDTETAQPVEMPSVEEPEKLRNLRVILYCLCGMTVILLGILVGSVVYYRKKLGKKDSNLT